jgi:hypothetical protein
VGDERLLVGVRWQLLLNNSSGGGRLDHGQRGDHVTERVTDLVAGVS